MNGSQSTLRTLPRLRGSIGVVALLAAAVFVPSVVEGEFLCYDDDHYVVHSGPVARGELLHMLDPRASREELGAEYLPVRDLTYALDARIWGVQGSKAARGFRATNLAFYALACALACVFVLELTGDALLALVTGAVFAAHPVHAESAAWIASRKDVVSGTLGFLALVLHLRASRRRSLLTPALGAAWVLGALAMLAKSTLVCLPALVLLSEAFARVLRPVERDEPRSSWLGGALARSAPYVLATVLVSWNAIEVGKRTGIKGELPPGGLATVAATDLPILVRYVGESFAPHDLRVSYATFPLRSPLDAAVLGAGLVLAVIAVLAALASRRARLLGFAAAWFGLALLPVLNFVPFSQLIADRYLFVPVLGPCLVVAWVVLRLGRSSKVLSLASLATVLLLFSWLACERGLDFASSERLFRANIALEPENPVAHHQLGRALLARAVECLASGEPGAARGIAREAAFEEETALRRFLRPDDPHASRRRGLELEARQSLTRDLELAGEPLAALACGRETFDLERSGPGGLHAASLRLRRLALRLREGALDRRDLDLLVEIARALALVHQDSLARETLTEVERVEPARAARALASDPELRRATARPEHEE